VIDCLTAFFDQNDLFSTTDTRLPLTEATNKLEAFVAFGSLMVIAFSCGRAVPFIVPRVVIRYAFDCELIDDDFEDWPPNMPKSILPFKSQLDAIRLGVLKMRPIPYHQLFKLDFFPRVVQMMPFCDFKEMIDENPASRMYTVFKGVRVIIEQLRIDKVRWRVDKARLAYKFSQKE
jgi:hypothetical protein